MDPSSASLSVVPADVQQLADLHEGILRIRGEIAKNIVGQQDAVAHLLTTLLAGGHALFVGVPGLAKTLLIQTLAQTLDLQFNRIQFTPDLMPADITGSDILDEDSTGKRHFRFVKGPVFAQLLLADEINRTPPKTQAALLQSMQERQVTASGRTHALPLPFHVFATQNPIEEEGTYPLPEAQLDRFMAMLRISYPSQSEEEQIVAQTTVAKTHTPTSIWSPKELQEHQALVQRIPAAPSLIQQAVAWVRQTRPSSDNAHPDAMRYVSLGAGPRAAQHWIMLAKARAALEGRPSIDMADLHAMALPVLRHRIMLNFHAEAENISTDAIIERILTAPKAS